MRIAVPSTEEVSNSKQWSVNDKISFIEICTNNGIVNSAKYGDKIQCAIQKKFGFKYTLRYIRTKFAKYVQEIHGMSVSKFHKNRFVSSINIAQEKFCTAGKFDVEKYFTDNKDSPYIGKLKNADVLRRKIKKISPLKS